MGLMGVNGVSGDTGASFLLFVTTVDNRIRILLLPLPFDSADADVDAERGGDRGIDSVTNTPPSFFPVPDLVQIVIGGIGGAQELAEFRFVDVVGELGNDARPDSDLEP